MEPAFYFILRYGLEGAVAGLVVFGLLKYFLPGYLSEKGKNLATSEDITEITEKIEAVKSDYSVLLEALKSKNQLRLAAIDKRLAVHQEAFTLWRELKSKVHTEDIGLIVVKCQSWWEQNCLYLEPAAREAFSTAYHAAASHRGFVQARDIRLIQENWTRITEVGQVIVEAVQLPRLTESELQNIDSPEEH